MVIRRGRGGGAAADVFRPSSLGRGYALQHHCASPHAVCACSPSGSSLPIGLATAYTISAAWQRHLVPISLAARGGVGPSRATLPSALPPHVHRRRCALSLRPLSRLSTESEARALLGGALGYARRRRRPGPAVVLRAASGDRSAEAEGREGGERARPAAQACPCELLVAISSPSRKLL